MDRSAEKIVLELRGSVAKQGLPLFNLETFIDHLLGGLRAFDRVRRAEAPRRPGAPGRRAEAVTAFRLVSFRRGSAILELEPIAPTPGGELVEEDSTLALKNLLALVDAIEREERIDPEVTEAFEGARRALGADGSIGVVYAGSAGKRQVRIDEEKLNRLERRALREPPRSLSISGRLHLIDVEPGHVGIRTTDGVDWVCRYPAELDRNVRALLDSNVWARGVGRRTSSGRGSLEIEEIQPIAEHEQTPLFTYERVPLEELMAAQGVHGPQGVVRVMPDDVSDAEFDDFIRALDEL